MLVPFRGTNDYSYRVDSIGTTRPGTVMGTTVTPGNNTKGSYATAMISSLARDCYFISIQINANTSAAAARNTIIDIGVDPAGGTAYSVLIPDLLGSCASILGGLSATGGVGVWYHFPVWIRAGSSISARASINNATVGTLAVRCIVYGSPKDPRDVRLGTKVTAIGIAAATSSGTAVTSGTTSEGAWTSLGAVAVPGWWWQLGMGVSDSTMGALMYYADLGLGDATNKFAVIENEAIQTSGSEALSKEGKVVGCEYSVPDSGVTAYGRLQCSGTADASLSMAAYCVSG